MSEVQAMLRNYVEVRNRLQRPPNAVPDTGINLRRDREESLPEPIELPKPKIELTATQRIALNTYKTSFRRHDLTFRNILRFVAEENGISLSTIMSKSRTRPLATLRQIAFWLANKHLSQSLSSMGKYLNLDHTSVLHGRDKIDLIVAGDTEFATTIKTLEVKLLAHFNRSPISALDQCPMEIEPGPCPQISEIFPVDISGGPTFDDPEAGTHQDVEGQVHCPTTAIPETP